MPKAKAGVSHWRQELVSIQHANRMIRQLVRKLLSEQIGSQSYHNLLTKIALETGTSDDAVNELRRIGDEYCTPSSLPSAMCTPSRSGIRRG